MKASHKKGRFFFLLLHSIYYISSLFLMRDLSITLQSWW